MRNKLNILWTNDNVITSELMVLMYATNAMRLDLWEEVRVIIWGATARLAADNTHIQELIAEAQEAGVKFSACQVCADKLYVKDKLVQTGIEVKLWGKPLTEILQNKEYLLTV